MGMTVEMGRLGPPEPRVRPAGLEVPAQTARTATRETTEDREAPVVRVVRERREMSVALVVKGKAVITVIMEVMEAMEAMVVMLGGAAFMLLTAMLLASKQTSKITKPLEG